MHMSQAYNDPLHELMDLFFIYAHQMQRTTATEWWALELTLAQLKVLFTLDFESEPTIGKIAEILDIGQPTASHLVDRLVQAGLVQRVQSSTDRRYTLASLTPQGEAMVRRLRQGRRDRLHSCLVHLDKEDVAALHQGMQALIRAFHLTSPQETEIRLSEDEHVAR